MPTTDEKAAKARKDALSGALTQIERQFGKGSVMRMGDPGAKVRVQAIPTGALSLDLALGIGGMPRGRIVELYGPEAGDHARSAVGMAELPLGMPVEIEAEVEITAG